MQATVKYIKDNGAVVVRVRRNYQDETIYDSWNTNLGLRAGDKVEVTRRPNNPYVIFVKKIGA